MTNKFATKGAYSYSVSDLYIHFDTTVLNGLLNMNGFDHILFKTKT